MQITLPLLRPSFDDDRLTDDTKKDFDKHSRVRIFRDNEVLDPSNDCEHIYSLWVEYGIDNESALMFEVDLDDLEMFANSLLKNIDMLRRDYSEQLKYKIKNNHVL